MIGKLLVLPVLFLLAALAVIGWSRCFRTRREMQKRREFTAHLLRDRESERRRVAGELHSNLGQNLLIIKNRAELGLQSSGNQDAVRDHLREISSLCADAIAESRRLALGLGPRYLAGIGLSGSLDAMLDRVAAATPIEFQRRIEPVDQDLNLETTMHVYRIAQEAVNNVLKHSQACHAKVELVRDLKELRFSVEDDGRGIPPAALGDGSRQGMGLPEMRERANILGGDFRLIARPGGGSRLTLVVPISEEHLLANQHGTEGDSHGSG